MVLVKILINRLAKLINAKIEFVKNESNLNELVLSINQRIIDPYTVLENKTENIGLNVEYFDASKNRVLIVDNNGVNLKELLLLLRPYKIEVDISKTLDNLTEKLSGDKTYDLVLMDDIINNFGYTLEKENVIAKLKRNAGYDFKTIIMLSKSKESNTKKYLKSGYDDYIIKPVNKKNINYILNKYLNNNEE